MLLTQDRLITAEELLNWPPEDRHGELVKGEFIPMPPASYLHGEIRAKMLFLLAKFVYSHQSGKLYTAATGFLLARNPDTVRARMLSLSKPKICRNNPKEDSLPARPTWL